MGERNLTMRLWCRFCYRLCFDWWPFRYRASMGWRFWLYLFFLPWAGEEAVRRGEL